MVNTRLSDLPASVAVAATDIFYGVQTTGVGGVKTTAAQLKTFMSASPTLVTPVLGVATATSLQSTNIGNVTPGTGAFTTLLLSGNQTFTSDNAFDIGANGANRPRFIYAANDITTAGNIILEGKLSWSSPGNGIAKITDIAGTSFNRIQLGGTTSSFPSLKRSSAILQARLADDSAFTRVQGILRTDVNAVTGLTAGVLSATTNASIIIEDASGQAYRIPCII